MILIRKIATRLISSPLISSLIRGTMGIKPIDTLVERGLIVGENLLIMNGVLIDPSHCWLITIGNNVVLSPFVHILAHDTSTKKWCGYTRIGRVVIGNNAFIGANSVILPGVTIGENSVIGAGSVVTHSIPDNVVAAGNPCRVISTLDSYRQKLDLQFESAPHWDERYTIRNNITPEMKREMKEKLSNTLGFVK